MRLLCKIEYDGSGFSGFQRQNGLRTVQGEAESALKRIYKKHIDIHSSSRTDAGVHAYSMYFHFDAESYISPDKLHVLLEKQLPADIGVLELKEVPSDFHARYDAKVKTYRYDVIVSDKKHIFMSRYALIYGRDVDYEKLNSALRIFRGERDYGALMAAGSDKLNTVRNIYDIRIESTGSGFSLYISANGFLYHMVRIIVGALLDINEGRRTEAELELGLQNRDRKTFRRTAPAAGLYLLDIEY